MQFVLINVHCQTESQGSFDLQNLATSMLLSALLKTKHRCCWLHQNDFTDVVEETFIKIVSCNDKSITRSPIL